MSWFPIRFPFSPFQEPNEAGGDEDCSIQNADGLAGMTGADYNRANGKVYSTMNHDSSDDSSRPFEPETPEAFFQQGEEDFQVWWGELDPPGSSEGMELDLEAARAVWAAAYEYNADPIMLVYDGAEANADGAHPTGEMQLACLIDRHHHGYLALPRRDFTDWVAKHEDHIRHEYSEDEDDARADTLTYWIDHAGQTPPTSMPRFTSRTSAESQRIDAADEFDHWWERLNPPGTLAWMSLDRETARLVWCAAYVRLWENLEVVLDSAKAHAQVVADTAKLELGYIIDRFHNGKLTLAVHDVMKYWDETKYVLERKRTDELITLRVLRVNEKDRHLS
jgi:hypothetical protein